MSKPTIIIICAIAWLPLLILNFFNESQVSDPGYVSFGQDISVHVRLLFALPIMLSIERIFHERLEIFKSETLEIMPDSHKEAFKRFFHQLQKYFVSGFILIGVSILLAIVLATTRIVSDYSATSWIYNAAGDLSPAGWWYSLVSTMIFVTVFLWWVVRWLVWVYLIFKTSRAPISLVPEHADNMAGLAYLNYLPSMFTWVFSALSAVISAMIAMQIMREGTMLTSYYVDITIICVGGTILLYAPLLFFMVKLDESQVKGIKKYGNLIRQHHLLFQQKWFDGDTNESILGSVDASSKSDIDASYAPLQNMQIIPMDKKNLIGSFITIALPLLPLVLLKYSLSDLVKALMNVVMG